MSIAFFYALINCTEISLLPQTILHSLTDTADGIVAV